MAVADDIPRSWSIVSLAALLLLAVAPPWLCIALGGASWRLVAAGALIWLASVLVKRLVVVAMRPLFRGLPSMAVAAMQGVISAVTELAPAAAFLATLPSATLPDLLGFGAGAGSTEVVYVLVIGIIWPQLDQEELAAWLRGGTVSWCVRYAVPIERLFALIGHVGARGLLYVALMDRSWLGPIWGLVAAMLFAIVDGVAIYGHLHRWPWHDPLICRRAHSFFAAMSLGEFTLLLIGFRSLG